MQGIHKQKTIKSPKQKQMEKSTDDLNKSLSIPKSEKEEEESSEVQSSPMDTSEKETPSETQNNKRNRQEEETSNKKQKTGKNLFRLTVSFPSGGPTFNYKDVLQEVLKHCNHVNNPGSLTAKFENTESLNKSFNSLCKTKIENKSLWLTRRYLPDVGSANPLKKLAYLPNSAVSQLEVLKEYYGAESIESLGKRGNSKLHVLTFKSDEAATAAAEKKGFESNGYVVNLRQFFEFDKKNADKGKEQSETSEEKSDVKEKEENVEEKSDEEEEIADEEEENADEEEENAGEEEEEEDEDNNEVNAGEEEDEDEVEGADEKVENGESVEEEEEENEDDE